MAPPSATRELDAGGDDEADADEEEADVEEGDEDAEVCEAAEPPRAGARRVVDAAATERAAVSRPPAGTRRPPTTRAGALAVGREATGRSTGPAAGAEGGTDPSSESSESSLPNKAATTRPAIGTTSVGTCQRR